MGVTSLTTTGSKKSQGILQVALHSNSRTLNMKQILYAAAIIAFLAISVKGADLTCIACMKIEGEGDQQIQRPWACGRDGAEKVEEKCNERVVGCVSENVRHRAINSSEWDEFEMKHCLDPQRPRAFFADMVPALQASGQDVREMARADAAIEVSGCMRYTMIEDNSGKVDNDVDICICDGNNCNEAKCVCNNKGGSNGGQSFAAFGILTAVAAVTAKFLA